LVSFASQDVLNEPDEITSTKGVQIPRKMSVDEITFAAHVDGTQNSEFIEAIQAQHVVRITQLFSF
jgi:cleavage and polyadenylation specificity factor subunit 3